MFVACAVNEQMGQWRGSWLVWLKRVISSSVNPLAIASFVLSICGLQMLKGYGTMAEGAFDKPALLACELMWFSSSLGQALDG